MIMSPGGISNYLIPKSSFGGVFYIDIFAVLIFIIALSITSSLKVFFHNHQAKKIFYSLLFFSFYKLFVWGLIIPPYHGLNEYFRYTIVRERDAIFGFLLIIPVYFLALKDLKCLVKVIMYTSTIILLLIFISIFTNINIVPVTTMSRYSDVSTVRLITGGYTSLALVLPLYIILAITKLLIKERRVAFIGSMLAIFHALISLTKTVYIQTIGNILGAILFISAAVRKGAGTKTLKTISVIFITLIIFNYSLPNYFDLSTRVFKDIFLLATEGETSSGNTSRLWQVEALKYEIKSNPIFGTGQGYEQLSEDFDINQWDATDFPLLAHIMQYGFMGISLYLIYFYLLYKLIRLLISTFKRLDLKYILSIYKYELIITTVSISYFISYLILPHAYFIEMTRGSARIEMTIHTALLLACLERIRNKNVLYNYPVLPAK